MSNQPKIKLYVSGLYGEKWEVDFNDRSNSGGLWENESKKGNTYLSGNLMVKGKEVRLVAYYNDEGEQPPRERTVYEDDDVPF